MEKDKKERTPRTVGKATAEPRGRDDAPAPKRWKGTRNLAEDSEEEGPGDDGYVEVEQNSKMIRVLMNQMGVLQKTVMERLPERKGTL